MGYRTRRTRLTIAALVAVALLSAMGMVLYAMHGRSASTAPRRAAPSSSATTALRSSARPLASPQPGDVDQVALEQVLDRMRQQPRPSQTTSLPLITGEATTQPDVFAGNFARGLLTQTYQTPRASLLAWVQAESTATADPLVVGLVPTNLRDRFAVYSVTDTSDGAAPVPTATEWTELATAHAWTSVRIDWVVEPTAWSDAVAAGRITDPGTTARLVSATVTRHTTIDRRSASEVFSVALTLNLEGPPTRPDWRFVAALTYTPLPLGGAS